MENLNLTYLRRTNFSQVYTDFILGRDLNNKNIRSLLELAILFLNYGDDCVKRLGYRIILKYTSKFADYEALYDVSINMGYYPISKFIERLFENRFSERFFNSFTSSFINNFKSGNIFLTEQQSEMIDGFSKNNLNTIAVIAPTSYGKSELILNCIEMNPNSNICIIVPTKALLAQTKRRILKSSSYSTRRKIITHPDMLLETDNDFIAVLTQERLLRLLEIYKELVFNIAIVDEAHNLFEDDSRNRLLASSIVILNKRNKHISFKFLSPFLVNSQNLKISNTHYEISESKISEYLKIDNFYCINFNHNKILKLYDQFLNDFIQIEKSYTKSDLEFIVDNSSNKNIIYVNSPPKLERIAKKLKRYTKQSSSSKILRACEVLSQYLHKDYSLIQCLRNGVVYHHGSVPDIVKLYIEYLFSTEDDIRFIVTSSTLLEGVNIPAERLFLLDYRKGRNKLSPSQFKNLVGRVCRFREIFDSSKGDLTLLEPKVYVVSSDYMPLNANIEKFLRESVREDKIIKDELTNVLLENTEISEENIKDKETAEEFLANFEQGILPNEDYRHASTNIGKLCFANNINEINIIEKEIFLEEKVNGLINYKANSAEDVIDLINDVFVEFIEEKDQNQNILRLSNQSARNFYTMFLKWQMRNAPYSELINRFNSYWDSIIQSNRDSDVYVGKWGDKIRSGHKPLWVDLREKSKSERINLAIIRIKEEKDFIENILIKFIEVLYDLKLIEDTVYKRIKYGTSDDTTILIIKNGYSNSLAHILLDKYREFLEINYQTSSVIARPELIDAMQKNNENDILVFEASYNVKST